MNPVLFKAIVNLLLAQLKEANSLDDNDYYVDVVGNAEEKDTAAGKSFIVEKTVRSTWFLVMKD